MNSHAPSSTHNSDRIIRPRELADQIGLSPATIWRLRRRGDLPEPVRLSPGCVGWLKSQIDAWLERRLERRPGSRA
jgi:prophage regulatory protein